MRTLLVVLCGISVGCHDAAPLSTPDAAEATASGLDPVLEIASLDRDQRMQLCVWATDELGGPGFMHPCNECTGDACIDYDVTVNTVAMCLVQLDAFAACHALVAEEEACLIAQAADLCATVPECQRLDRCL